MSIICIYNLHIYIFYNGVLEQINWSVCRWIDVWLSLTFASKSKSLPISSNTSKRLQSGRLLNKL